MRRTVADQELYSFLGADHHDPHNLLGIHPVEGGVAIRAFNPDAAEMAAIDIHDATNRYQLNRLADEGFFEAVIPHREIFAYNLHTVTFRGEHTTERDGYSFMPLLGELDLHLWGEGTHYQIHEKLGAHVVEVDGVTGVRFALWAPNARRVSVVGEWNNWDGRVNPMRALGASGVWEVFLPGVSVGAIYKYEIKAQNGDIFDKADPFAYQSELRPQTASVVCRLGSYAWEDQEWMQARREEELLNRPMNIYEVHLGSWARSPDGSAWLSYREVAPLLVEYCLRQGYTHIELLPISEHPFDGSWGYQVTGYFSPTSRFGSPDDFKYFVDFFHHHGIGVFFDWVPAHFPKDAFGLRRFDGTALFEHEDPRKGEHKDWGTLIFNYGRPEVKNFLLSSALFWLTEYHLDGLRVDAVASMLYLDYSKEQGEWVANELGGNENLEAIELLKTMNSLVHEKFPGAVTMAEESTSWPGVSRPTYLGGLGFTMKWNMGWMHDVLEYFSKDPVHRKHHHNNLTFSMLYAFHENFILPLSHDEVVHGKGSLVDKMPGDTWQKFANLRLLYSYMYGHPGKKLLFQGGDMGEWREWNHERSIDWGLLRYAPHARLQCFMADLARLYREEPSFWENDFGHEGFQWIDCNDSEASVISWMRFGRDRSTPLIFVFNMTPVVRENYRLGAPEEGWYRELLNSDAAEYYGSGVGNGGGVQSDATPWHGLSASLNLTLPPLGCLIFKKG